MGKVILIVLLLAAIGGGVWYLHAANKSDYPPPQAGEDSSLIKFLDDNSAKEARQWLNDNPERMLTGMTRSQAAHFLDRLYDMGATKVYAGGGLACMWVVVQLPDDPAKRKTLIDWQHAWTNDYVKPASDVGQRYLQAGLHL
jgi:hypothetical protein